jgi:hypothetical protein
VANAATRLRYLVIFGLETDANQRHLVVYKTVAQSGVYRINPCERGGRLYEADRTEQIWCEGDIAKHSASPPSSFIWHS